MRHALALVVALGAAGASADEVILKHGGRLVGDIRERRPDAIVVETGPGLVTVPMSQVARVVVSASPLSIYQARAARLGPRDAEGWFDLALWAFDQGLNTQARLAVQTVLAINPNHSGAHQAAGHVLHDGRWMTSEDSYRAQGLVPFEGSWVAPAEREAILAERAAYIEDRRLRAEADARVREAEARARTAEAEARRAEADLAQAPVDGGIPYYPYGFGGGYVAPPIVNDPFLPPPPVVVVKPHGHRDRPPRDDAGRHRRHGSSSGSRGGSTTRALVPSRD